MRKNILLIFAFLVSVLLVVNGAKRILSLRSTSKGIEDAQARLEKVKKENEQLKGDLEYKKSQEFTEGEIRNKLGLAKQNEAVVVVPKEEQSADSNLQTVNEPNWQKWWDLFFGG